MAVNLHESIYREIADFLVSQPTLETFANYQVPPAVQQRIDLLLEKNAEGHLLGEERLELEKILAITSVMDLTKVKAKLKLMGKT